MYSKYNFKQKNWSVFVYTLDQRLSFHSKVLSSFNSCEEYFKHFPKFVINLFLSFFFLFFFLPLKLKYKKDIRVQILRSAVLFKIYCLENINNNNSNNSKIKINKNKKQKQNIARNSLCQIFIF